MGLWIVLALQWLASHVAVFLAPLGVEDPRIVHGVLVCFWTAALALPHVAFLRPSPVVRAAVIALAMAAWVWTATTVAAPLLRAAHGGR